MIRPTPPVRHRCTNVGPLSETGSVDESPIRGERPITGNRAAAVCDGARPPGMRTSVVWIRRATARRLNTPRPRSIRTRSRGSDATTAGARGSTGYPATIAFRAPSRRARPRARASSCAQWRDTIDQIQREDTFLRDYFGVTRWRRKAGIDGGMATRDQLPEWSISPSDRRGVTDDALVIDGKLLAWWHAWSGCSGSSLTEGGGGRRV